MNAVEVRQPELIPYSYDVSKNIHKLAVCGVVPGEGFDVSGRYCDVDVWSHGFTEMTISDILEENMRCLSGARLCVFYRFQEGSVGVVKVTVQHLMAAMSTVVSINGELINSDTYIERISVIPIEEYEEWKQLEEKLSENSKPL